MGTYKYTVQAASEKEALAVLDKSMTGTKHVPGPTPGFQNRVAKTVSTYEVDHITELEDGAWLIDGTIEYIEE